MSHRSAWACALASLSLFGALGLWGEPALAEPTLRQVAGPGGDDGNLDGPVATATWGGGPLVPKADGDGWLVMDHYASTLRRIDKAQAVSTLSGKPGQGGMVDGARRAARFSWPSDVVRGPDGRIYVADQGNDAIRVMDAQGLVSTLSVRPAPQQDEPLPALDNPSALAFDAQGRLWVLLEYSHDVLIVEADGSMRLWRTADQRPELVDLTADHQGSIWGITATQVGRVHLDRFEVLADDTRPEWQPPIAYRVVPPRGGPVAAHWGQVPFVGRAPLPPMPEPPLSARQPVFRDLSLDADGSVYIAEAQRILQLPAGGSTLKTLFTLPESSSSRDDDGFVHIAARQGEVLVATHGEGLYKLDKAHVPRPYSGVWSPHDELTITDKATLQAHWQNMDDATLLQRDGSIIYLDRLDSAIIRRDQQGLNVTWAGERNEKGRQDGPLRQARFQYPSDMVQARSGDIYVADSGNGLIRRITPQGQVSTLAGRMRSQERADGIGTQARFWQPKRITLDESRGRLYVLDSNPYLGGGGVVLRRIDLATAQVSTIDPVSANLAPVDEATLASLMEAHRFPTLNYEDIAVGADGALYALENGLGGDLVWRIHPDTGLHTLLFTPAQGPFLSERSEGDEGENHLIRCERLWCSPERIEADAHGNVYLSDSGNHTVIRIDAKGQAGVIVGQAGLRGNLPGALPGALNRPDDLGWSSDGDLLIPTGRSGLMVLSQPHKASVQQSIKGLR